MVYRPFSSVSTVAGVVFGCMAYFERHAVGQGSDAFCQEVEIVNAEVILVSSVGVIAMRDVEDVIVHVFLYHKPWAASESESLALPDCVEPQSFVFTDDLTGFQFDDIARLLSKVTAYVFVVVDVAKEADTL